MSHWYARWLRGAVLVGINALLSASLVITGTIGPAPAPSAYGSAPPPNDSLLYNVRLQNVVVKDGTDAVVLQATEDGLSSAAANLSLPAARARPASIAPRSRPRA